VSDAASGPMPYQVVYSERVRQRLPALADLAVSKNKSVAFTEEGRVKAEELFRKLFGRGPSD
jgi:hypothetical protein